MAARKGSESGLTRLAFCGCRRASDSEEEDREPRLSGPASLKDADRAVLERAADSLHCAGVNSKPFGNDAHTGPPTSRQSLADSFFECGGNRWATEAFTFTPGPRKPGTDSFRNHRPLEFGKHAHHLKHRLPAGVVVSSPCWRRNRSILSAC